MDHQGQNGFDEPNGGVSFWEWRWGNGVTLAQCPVESRPRRGQERLQVPSSCPANLQQSPHSWSDLFQARRLACMPGPPGQEQQGTPKEGLLRLAFNSQPSSCLSFPSVGIKSTHLALTNSYTDNQGCVLLLTPASMTQVCSSRSHQAGLYASCSWDEATLALP